MEVAHAPRQLLTVEPAQQLDFYESMTHFKTMFPTMEEGIIEAVLRANSGAVDATVDQLLNMSSDCTGASQLDLTNSSCDFDSDDVTEGAAAPPDFFTINVIAPSPKATATQQSSPRSQMPQPSPKSSPNCSSSLIDGQRVSANRFQDDAVTLPQRPPHSHSHAHNYKTDVNILPEIDEDAPPIPEKPACLRTTPNIMDASITDLVNLGTDASNLTNSPFGTQMDTLTVDKENDIFVTPTNLSIQEVIPDAPVAHDPRKGAETAPVAGKRVRSMSMPIFQHNHLSPVSLNNKFRPVMLGELPDDFLRFNLTRNPHGDTVDSAPQNTSFKQKEGNAHPRYHKRSVSEQGHMLRYTSHKRHHPGVHSSGIEPPTRHHPGVHSSGIEPPTEATAVSREWIAGKLIENERKRAEMVIRNDVQAVQLLEDEYLALMLQNEEFLLELRRDDEFMSTLQLDRIHGSSDEDPSIPAVQAQEPDLEPDAPKPSEMQGYEDEDKSNGTYLERDAPSSDDTMELRKQLAHMGASSKKKFLILARRFFSRKKKTPSKPLYSQAHTPSTMNLLLEEETPEMDDVTTSHEKSSEEIAKVPSSYRIIQRPPYSPDCVVTHHHDNDWLSDAAC